MTRSELIQRLADRLAGLDRGQGSELGPRDCEVSVRVLLDAMTQSLANGQRIEIRGFGTFSVSSRPPRVGRNPKSGEMVSVPAKRVPHFKPGKELRLKVNQPGESADGAD